MISIFSLYYDFRMPGSLFMAKHIGKCDYLKIQLCFYPYPTRQYIGNTDFYDFQL